MSNSEISPSSIDYQDLFNKAVILDGIKSQAIIAAKRILAARAKYEQLCDHVNPYMPWYFPGIIHSLECGNSFARHLHNGDSLKYRTVNKPAGRPVADPESGAGQPYSWLESAVDAMLYDGFATLRSWTLPLMLYRFEKYNGMGYQKHGINSPYLWSGTNLYVAGKYDTDGHYNPSLISQQVGCVVLLKYVTDKTLGLV